MSVITFQDGKKLDIAKLPVPYEVAYCGVCAQPVCIYNDSITDKPVVFCPDCITGHVEDEANERMAEAEGEEG